MDCRANFQELINSNFDSLKVCIDEFNKHLREDIGTYDDVLNGKCYRVNNKKEEFYNKDYDVSNVVDFVKTSFGEDSEYYHNFMTTFDTDTKTEKCCNCVNVSLYITNKSNVTALSRFIFTIYLSILNMENFLSDWVYRLHIDPSVFENLYELKTMSELPENIMADTVSSTSLKTIYETYLTTLKKIAAHKQVEIFLSNCISFDIKSNTGLKRTSRFISLIDDSVSISTSREADGLISPIDCYNLKISEQINSIGLVYPLTENEDTGSTPANIYYKKKYNMDLIKEANDDSKKIIFSVSAGLLTLKCKVNKKYFEECIKLSLGEADGIDNNKVDYYKSYDEQFVAELLKNFCIGKSKDKLKILKVFGVISRVNTFPILPSDNLVRVEVDFIKDTIINRIYKTLPEAFVSASEAQKFFTNFMSEIDIKYTNDTTFIFILKKLIKVMHSYDYDSQFYYSNLISYYFYNKYYYIEIIKTNIALGSNKLLLTDNIIDELNITTGDTKLINKNEYNSGYNLDNYNDLLLVFNSVNSVPVGGAHNNSQKYYQKYLKYKNKYVALKNNK